MMSDKSLNSPQKAVEKLIQKDAPSLKGYLPEIRERILSTFCCQTIYPYPCENIASTINRSGFPPVYLTPMNFDEMYEQRRPHKNFLLAMNLEKQFNSNNSI